jgi:serine/threonine-protein kinase
MPAPTTTTRIDPFYQEPDTAASSVPDARRGMPDRPGSGKVSGVRIDQVLHGRYRLLDQLGTGGMSVVWRARDEVLDRDVAVKVLAGPYAADPASRAQLRAEARATARLQHPHVTDIYDYGEWIDESGAPVPYVVMELLPGRTLSQRLAAGPLPPKLAMRICSEVAAALAAAHAAGLVHRDVKPSNVMVTPAGAKVFDFGIAAAVGRGELEHNGDLLGTPAYLAPERLTGGDVLPASDVYALGLLVHRVFTTRLPWSADTATQMLRAHVYARPAPLPSLAGVPAAVNDICDRCLAKEPADRPSAAQVATVFAAAAGIVPPPEDTDPDARPDEPLLAAVPRPAAAPAAGPATAGWPRRRRLLLAGGAVLSAVVALGAALIRPEPPADGAAGAPPVPAGVQSAGSRVPATAGPSRPAGGTGPAPSASRAGPPAQRTAGPVRSRSTGPTPGPGRTTGGAAPDPTVATSAPPPAGTTVTARGGSIRVSCAGRAATVLAVTPAPGYTVKDHDPGPAAEVQVVLLSADNESEIKVKCKAGGPQPAIKESPQ